MNRTPGGQSSSFHRDATPQTSAIRPASSVARRGGASVATTTPGDTQQQPDPVTKANQTAQGISDLLQRHHGTMQEAVVLLTKELHKTRQDSDYYRQKLAIAMNQVKLHETDVLIFRKQIREKEEVIEKKDLRIAEMKAENDVLSAELKKLHMHGEEQKKLLSLAFDDSGRNRSLLQNHLHNGCNGESGPGNRSGSAVAATNTNNGVSLRHMSPMPRPSGRGSSPFRPVANSNAIIRSGSYTGAAPPPPPPLPPSSSALNSSANLEPQQQQGSGISGFALLRQQQQQQQQQTGAPGSGQRPPVSPLALHDKTISPKRRSDSVPEQEKGGPPRSQSPLASNPNKQEGLDYSVTAGRPTASTPVRPRREATNTVRTADLGTSMGVVQSHSGNLTTAAIDDAVVSYRSLSSEDHSFVLRIKSTSVKDVVFGLEASEGGGTLCECGFRSDGYVVAVTRTGFAQHRDIWNGVLERPVGSTVAATSGATTTLSPTTESGKDNVMIEVCWIRSRKTLDIMVDGVNVTLGQVVLTNSETQPPPYYPVVKLPCRGDEVILLQ